jgi:hypothetical protein
MRTSSIRVTIPGYAMARAHIALFAGIDFDCRGVGKSISPTLQRSSGKTPCQEIFRPAPTSTAIEQPRNARGASGFRLRS